MASVSIITSKIGTSVIKDTLIPAAYKFYQQEYIDYAMGDDDNPGEVELFGDEYSCPIPEEWLPS